MRNRVKERKCGRKRDTQREWEGNEWERDRERERHGGGGEDLLKKS